MFKPFETVPIGIFDSGVGGLSVWSEAIKILPRHRFIYFADSANAPYGSKTIEQIIERSLKITEFLLDKGAGIIVVACNTATSAAISVLREKYDVPFIGMEPAVKPAASLTNTGVIGVLATQGTLNGRMYHLMVNRYAFGVKVVEQAGTGLVNMVESGNTEGEETEELLKHYIGPMVEDGADYIVLGCTHYPFLRDSIEKIAGDKVTIIDPAPAVARHLYKKAREINLIEEHTRTQILGVDLYKSCYADTHFFSSGETGVLKKLARSIIPEIPDNYFHKADI